MEITRTLTMLFILLHLDATMTFVIYFLFIYLFSALLFSYYLEISMQVQASVWE